MKLYAFRRFLHTAEYYDYTVSQDPETGLIDTTYFFVGTVKMTVSSRGTGLHIYTDEVLRYKGKLRNFRDEAGNPLLESYDESEPLEFQVQEVEPITNALGYSEGYRYTARQIGIRPLR